MSIMSASAHTLGLVSGTSDSLFASIERMHVAHRISKQPTAVQVTGEGALEVEASVAKASWGKLLDAGGH
jgi:hypothetical protein